MTDTQTHRGREEGRRAGREGRGGDERKGGEGRRKRNEREVVKGAVRETWILVSVTPVSEEKIRWRENKAVDHRKIEFRRGRMVNKSDTVSGPTK